MGKKENTNLVTRLNSEKKYGYDLIAARLGVSKPQLMKYANGGLPPATRGVITRKLNQMLINGGVKNVA